MHYIVLFQLKLVSKLKANISPSNVSSQANASDESSNILAPVLVYLCFVESAKPNSSLWSDVRPISIYIGQIEIEHLVYTVIKTLKFVIIPEIKCDNFFL